VTSEFSNLKTGTLETGITGGFPLEMSQMEDQKTVIEKKKLEIIEKHQRHQRLVKAIHANMKTILSMPINPR
jgi:hypothetical protein